MYETPEEILESKTLEKSTKLVYPYLRKHGPTVSSMACSRALCIAPASVKAAIDQLEAEGWITVQRVARAYVLTFPKESTNA